MTNAIHYRGERGYTQSCIEAISHALEHESIEHATLLAYKREGEAGDSMTYFAAVLHHVDHDELTIIADGFAAGYSGEGPRGLVSALDALLTHGIPMSIAHPSHAKADALLAGRMDFTAVCRVLADGPEPLTLVPTDKGHATIAVKWADTLAIRSCPMLPAAVAHAIGSLAPTLAGGPRPGPDLAPGLSPKSRRPS